MDKFLDMIFKTLFTILFGKRKNIKKEKYKKGIKEIKNNNYENDIKKLLEIKEENKKDLEEYYNKYKKPVEKIKQETKYKINHIMTFRELGFFKWLKNYLKDNQEINIFTKIRLADLLIIKDFESYGEKMGLFRKISQKHIDFILSDTNGKVLCLIELDDNTHNYQKTTIENDIFKNELFENLEIPLIRYKIGETWDFSKISNILYGETKKAL